MNNYIIILFFIAALLATLTLTGIAQLQDSAITKRNFHSIVLGTLNIQNKKVLFIRYFVALVVGMLYAVLMNNFFLKANADLNISNLLLWIFITINFFILVYYSVFDFIYYEVPGKITVIQFSLLLIFNILLFAFTQTINLPNGIVYMPLSNIIAGLLYGGLFLSIVLFTKENGMGGGDIRIAGIIGLLLGAKATFLSFYASVFTALVVGIIYSIYLKKFRGIRLPFVPFLTLGMLLTACFYSELLNFANNTLFIRL